MGKKKTQLSSMNSGIKFFQQDDICLKCLRMKSKETYQKVHIIQNYA